MWLLPPTVDVMDSAFGFRRGLLARYLTPGERVLAVTRAHPVVLAGPAAAALFGIAGAALVGLLVSPTDGSDRVDVLLGIAAIALSWVLDIG